MPVDWEDEHRFGDHETFDTAISEHQNRGFSVDDDASSEETERYFRGSVTNWLNSGFKIDEEATKKEMEKTKKRCAVLRGLDAKKEMISVTVTAPRCVIMTREISSRTLKICFRMAE